MNWMLVLFMGTSTNYSVIKTDLIFKDEQTCFNYESKLAQKQVDAMNVFLRKWNPNINTEENTSNRLASNWAALQYPRGTCIPTTAKETIK